MYSNTLKWPRINDGPAAPELVVTFLNRIDVV